MQQSNDFFNEFITQNTRLGRAERPILNIIVMKRYLFMLLWT